MLTYFHGTQEMQAPDGLQTLYLMNSTMNPLSPQPEHFATAPVSAQDSGRASSLHSSHEMLAVQGLVPHLQHHLWTATASHYSIDKARQGLSLSLPPQQTPFTPYRPEPEIPGPVTELQHASAEEFGITGSSASASAISSRISGLPSIIRGSKYLKAAQQLLDEVATVGKDTKGGCAKGASKGTDGIGAIDANKKQGAELTTAERQELQMKKAKLIGMLDEVEQRYREYQHQMQTLISSFEAVLGPGSARTYTGLALKTISKQFRFLRDAISGRIRALGKSLGEEDCLGESRTPGSRPLFFDHHLRQQRAVQQLGMMQHNAWRPQRGLPERSVSVLRAWLFEHFLHPYPKDSDKLMLAKQTGLTRSQVSNWFINARVRLWKPMVEEMYLEEMKEQEQNKDVETSPSDVRDDLRSKCSAGCENSATGTDQAKLTPPRTAASPPSASNHVRNQAGSYSNDEIVMQSNGKKARTGDSLHPTNILQSINVELKSREKTKQEHLIDYGQERQSADRSHKHSFITGSASHAAGFGPYHVGDIGRFNPEQFAPWFTGNAVSLTLGLPHGEALSLSGAQQSYISSESIPMGRRL